MLLNKKDVNRIAIYFFFDEDGIVDSYVFYFLECLMKSCKKIIFVSNGKLDAGCYQKLSKIENLEILERENKGFDVWAYREGLNKIGFDNLDNYDEIVALNFTIMGPIYPLEEMFEKMNKVDVDFWGITKHHPIPFDIFEGRMPEGIEEHVQSSFLVFRNSLLKTQEFKDYWINMPPVKDYFDAICLHEAIFTKKFERMGFKWDVYVQSDDLRDTAYYPLQMIPLELLKNRNCPIFKRRNFFHNYQAFINYTAGEPTYEMYEFIKNKTDYDVNMIWENVIRSMNQAEFKKAMQLNYILPTQMSPDIKPILKTKKVALIMHLFYMDLLDSMLSYASSMPPEADVYITVISEDNKKEVSEKFKTLKCNKLNVMVIENKGRDVSSLLVACKDIVKDYDYICFAHDKKTTQLRPYTMGQSFAYQCFENVLKNENYVNNVINTFNENENLGMLMPPPPMHADYFPTIGLEWRKNYEGAKKFMEEHNMVCPMREDCEPISPLGTIFWFRSKALKSLFECGLTYDDFPQEPNNIDNTLLHQIERIYGLAVQANGYYPAWVLSDSFAKIYITNLFFTVREFNKVMFRCQIESTQYNMVNQLGWRLDKIEQLRKRIPGKLLALKNKIVRFLKRHI